MNEYIRIIEVESAKITIPAKQGAKAMCPKTSLEGYEFIGFIAATPNGDASIICQTNEWAHNHNDIPKTISVTYQLLFRKITKS